MKFSNNFKTVRNGHLFTQSQNLVLLCSGVLIQYYLVQCILTFLKPCKFQKHLNGVSDGLESQSILNIFQILESEMRPFMLGTVFLSVRKKIVINLIPILVIDHFCSSVIMLLTKQVILTAYNSDVVDRILCTFLNWLQMLSVCRFKGIYQ